MLMFVSIITIIHCHADDYHQQYSQPLSFSPSSVDRLVGLVVKASASRVEDLGFESRLRWDLSGSSHTSDFKIGFPVATREDVIG